jgi:hypothetical protein
MATGGASRRALSCPSPRSMARFRL